MHYLTELLQQPLRLKYQWLPHSHWSLCALSLAVGQVQSFSPFAQMTELSHMGRNSLTQGETLIISLLLVGKLRHRGSETCWRSANEKEIEAVALNSIIILPSKERPPSFKECIKKHTYTYPHIHTQLQWDVPIIREWGHVHDIRGKGQILK